VVGAGGSILRVATAGTGTAIEEEPRADRGIPRGIALSLNYPNPFNTETVIPFTLSEDGHVELSLYNLAGQQVATLSEGMRRAGTHAVHFGGRDSRGRSLASGVYICRLSLGADQQVRTRKLVLLR